MTNKPQPKIIGRFWFRKTSNGNLIGEYSNQLMQSGSTESADLETLSDIPDEFSGTYNTTWYENSGAVGATLKIKLVRKKIWEVTWTRGSRKIFEGEAMLGEELLIGNYWSC